MYLRTPKRYTRGHKRSIISLRWLWLWIVAPVIVAAGVYLYNNRDTYSPQIGRVISGIMSDAQNSVATAMAPTPLPTENPERRLESANNAWERGAVEEAVNIYQGLLDAVPNDVNTHYRVALGLVMSGQLDEALEAAEDTVTANPYSPDAWAIRAMVLDWNGRVGESIASGLRALELAGQDNPQSEARALAFLAEAYFDAEQYDRALSTAERALEVNPDSFEANRVRALIAQGYEYLNDVALEYYQAAYDIAPNLPYIAIELALVQSALGETEQAVATLAQLVELNPRNTNALLTLGTLYLNSIGDPNQAVDQLSRCIEADPENIDCHYVLGRAQQRLEQFESAAISFETAINLGTTSPRHYWWAGYAQVTSGKGCPAAAVYLQKGYEMALAGGDEALISDFEDQMRSCQLLAPLPEETLEATAEATEE
jgi:tetratricopeptide (TPR) repeat protein